MSKAHLCSPVQQKHLSSVSSILPIATIGFDSFWQNLDPLAIQQMSSQCGMCCKGF